MRATALAALMLCLLGSVAGAADIRTGIASTDDGKPTRFDGGNFAGKLSTGGRFTDGMFVAHRDLPLGSCVDVSLVGRKAQVFNARIDDRGPCGTPHCQKNSPRLLQREIDLKPKLASAMGCDGLCRVAYWPAPCSSTIP